MIKENMSRQELMRQLQIASFAVHEANLFLDTHPTNKEGIAYFNKYNKLKEELTEELTERFGPVNLNQYEVTGETWDWVAGPWPWEREE